MLSLFLGSYHTFQTMNYLHDVHPCERREGAVGDEAIGKGDQSGGCVCR